MPQKQSCMKSVRHNVSISIISIALYLSLYNTTVRLHFLQLHKATIPAPQAVDELADPWLKPRCHYCHTSDCFGVLKGK